MIPAEKSHLRSSAHSHPGQGGKANQDRYWVSAYSVGLERRMDSVLAILTDGIGGRRSGDVAAQLALDTVKRAVESSHASQPTGILQAAFIQAGQVVLSGSESKSELQGMGSTCLVAWVLGDRLYTANVGNSRLYLLRQGSLLPLNVPHEFIREEDAGEKGKDRKSTKLGQLRTFLGSNLSIEPDFRMPLRAGQLSPRSVGNQGFRLRPNDRLLLCSDGLSDVLNEEEILDLLGGSEVEDAAKDLIEAVLEKGGQDNVTAVVLGVPPARPTSAQERRRQARRWLVTLISIILLVFVSLYAWQYWVPAIEPVVASPGTALPTHTPLPTNTPEG
jgi:protein phosphatase